MTRVYELIAFIFALLFSTFAFASDTAPDVLVKHTTEEALAIIKQDKELQSGDRKKVLDLIEAKILPHFDFIRMTRLAVGKNWSQATHEQQEALVREFRSLLVRTYTAGLAVYKNQTVEVRPLNVPPGETDVTVRTHVNQPGAQSVLINFSMHKTPDGWKVYDVTVDGVGLVMNYRTTFANEIRNSGIDGLIKTLAAKNRTSDVPQTTSSMTEKMPGKAENN